MTPEEREKLVKDMAKGIASAPRYPWEKMTEREKQLTIDTAGAALDIAQAAFAKEIEAAYKEGWQAAASISRDPNDWLIDWQHSNTRAGTFASIPEKKNN